MRLHIRATIQQETPLKLSFKENMPQSTIMVKLDKTDEELLKEMNSGCAERVKKDFELLRITKLFLKNGKLPQMEKVFIP